VFYFRVERKERARVKNVKFQGKTSENKVRNLNFKFVDGRQINYKLLRSMMSSWKIMTKIQHDVGGRTDQVVLAG